MRPMPTSEVGRNQFTLITSIFFPQEGMPSTSPPVHINVYSAMSGPRYLAI